MSLRWRLALIVAGTVAVTVSIASFGAYVVTANQLQSENDRFLTDRSKVLTEELVDTTNDRGRKDEGGGRGGHGPGGPGPPPARTSRSPFDQPDALVQYLTTSGVQNYSNAGVTLPVNQSDKDVAAGRLSSAIQDVDIEGVHYRMLTTPVGQSGALQIARSVASADDVLSGLRTRMLLLGMAGTVFAAAVGWLVARQFVRPVERLTTATEKIAATQDLAESITVDRKDEVGRLAESFNSMLLALSTAREQQRRLVQDASHELRTPLTSLRTNIEVLSSEDRLDPVDRARLIDDVGLELVELTDLVNELVVLAQASSPEDEPISDIELDALTAAAVERTRRRTDRHIDVHLEPCVVRGRPSELDRVVTNLLNNATKFSPEGTPIDVRVAGGRVEVRDHGPGIAPEDRAHVFERFYRSDAARSAPGSGLGLSIVEQVVRASGGTVFVDDAPGGGAVVGFELPSFGS